MPSVLVPVADGSEEMEMIILVDILRRADFEVTIASLTGEMIVASRGTKIVPDCSMDDAQVRDFDLVVLPGGTPGADHLGKDTRVQDILKKTADDGHLVGAICAAPRVLAQAGLLDGKRATCYPGFLDGISASVASTGKAVEQDGNVITSRAAGTAVDFAPALVEALADTQKRDEVEKGLVRT